MEPISPPKDYFSNFNKDLNKETILKLSYKDIINICKSNKSLNNICKDPYFWKAKLQYDYPDEDTSQLRGDEYKAQYELLLIEPIKEEIQILM